MNLQLNDRLRAILIRGLVDDTLGNGQTYLVLSKDTLRTNINNDDLSMNGLDSIYNGSNIIPKYITRLISDNTDYYVGGLKSRLGSLEDSIEITINNVEYLFVKADVFLENFNDDYKDKLITSIYIVYEYIQADKSEVYNIATVINTSELPDEVYDFTKETPPSMPTLTDDGTAILAQAQPADTWLPDSDAPTEAKRARVLLNF